MISNKETIWNMIVGALALVILAAGLVFTPSTHISLKEEILSVVVQPGDGFDYMASAAIVESDSPSGGTMESRP